MKKLQPEKTGQITYSNRWRFILLGILLLVCFICLGLFIFEFSLAGSAGNRYFSISLRSILTPDYSQDKQVYSIPVVGIALIDSALEDQNTTTSLPDIIHWLQTPVPSITPNLTPLSFLTPTVIPTGTKALNNLTETVTPAAGSQTPTLTPGSITPTASLTSAFLASVTITFTQNPLTMTPSVSWTYTVTITVTSTPTLPVGTLNPTLPQVTVTPTQKTFTPTLMTISSPTKTLTPIIPTANPTGYPIKPTSTPIPPTANPTGYPAKPTTPVSTTYP